MVVDRLGQNTTQLVAESLWLGLAVRRWLCKARRSTWLGVRAYLGFLSSFVSGGGLWVQRGDFVRPVWPSGKALGW